MTSPSGDAMLKKPSLAERLPNGLIMVNDDYRNRVVVIDPATDSIVWQYGITDVSGTTPGCCRFRTASTTSCPTGPRRPIRTPAESAHFEAPAALGRQRDNDASGDSGNPARSPSKGCSRQRRVSGALRREERGDQVKGVDVERRGEGNPSQGGARRCAEPMLVSSGRQSGAR